MKTFKHACKACGDVFEYPMPEPDKVVEKLKCTCGITEEVRTARAITTCISTVVVSILMAMVAGCFISHRSELEKVKAMPESYRIGIKNMGIADDQIGVFNKSDADKRKETIAELKKKIEELEAQDGKK